jgi:coenzyme F390 synthetase
MEGNRFFRVEIECLPRDDLNALIDERVRYTISYAAGHSPFYRAWFRHHRIDPESVRSHEDLINLPVISGKTIRENQPPVTDEFMFRSVDWDEVFTIHETSGTSGTPKSFFLTWDDWLRYAEKYARSFVSQGFSRGDRIVICASYGMNVGANTMTLAARDIRATIVPIGNCSFPGRIIRSYRPTGIVGSVFKLLHLAARMREEGMSPEESPVRGLIVGGESFADESRAYLSEVWDREVFNTYGSTEGTMCGECTVRQGLHVPEDLVHLDVYDPALERFVGDGECGRAVLTTLIPVGGRAGTLLINYDTEDTTVVTTRDPCPCGRTHMKIMNPQREAETVWILGTPVNRVDIERGVFQRENMEYLTGEYESFVYGSEESAKTTLIVSMEIKKDISAAEKDLVTENFKKSFYRYKPALLKLPEDIFSLLFSFAEPGRLELSRIKGRPKRLVDRRA